MKVTFRYPTSYRYYSLAKVGFGLAFLWFVYDFLRIHQAIWQGLSLLLPDPQHIAISGSPELDVGLRRLAIALSAKAMVWAFVALAPIAVGLFLWGRHRWLQFAVGGWMSFSMIGLNGLVGVFSSTVDVWVNLTFLLYALAALTSPAAAWDQSEPGLCMTRWRENATLASAFAWLVVWLQFLVYVFAGVNKLVLGWTPWTTGVALQNLAIDSSMRDFARGIPVPFWISLVLCYVTLLQRLVVPFGFFFRRGRLWSVLILGSMHLIYAVLMNVNLFPLIGIASLLVILPPAEAAAAEPRTPWVGRLAVGLCALLLLAESARLTEFRPRPWENKLMLTPGWRMFADGGVAAGGEWRVIVGTARERIDATPLALQVLPHGWRDRFYVNNILNDLLNKNMGPGSLVDRLGRGTRRLYRDSQIRAHENPFVANIGFEIYQWTPPPKAGAPATR